MIDYLNVQQIALKKRVHDLECKGTVFSANMQKLSSLLRKKLDNYPMAPACFFTDGRIIRDTIR